MKWNDKLDLRAWKTVLPVEVHCTPTRDVETMGGASCVFGKHPYPGIGEIHPRHQPQECLVACLATHSGPLGVERWRGVRHRMSPYGGAWIGERSRYKVEAQGIDMYS